GVSFLRWASSRRPCSWMAARWSLSIPSLGPTTLFSHSNCLLTFVETSVLLSAAFFFFSARLAVAPVTIRSAMAADAANLDCISETSAVGVGSSIIRIHIRRGNHIVGEIINTYTQLHMHPPQSRGYTPSPRW